MCEHHRERCWPAVVQRLLSHERHVGHDLPIGIARERRHAARWNALGRPAVTSGRGERERQERVERRWALPTGAHRGRFRNPARVPDSRHPARAVTATPIPYSNNSRMMISTRDDAAAEVHVHGAALEVADALRLLLALRILRPLGRLRIHRTGPPVPERDLRRRGLLSRHRRRPLFRLRHSHRRREDRSDHNRHHSHSNCPHAPAPFLLQPT